MMNLLKRNPLLSGILYEALAHLLFWGPVFITTQLFDNIAMYSIFLFPIPVCLSLAFPFIHQKMLSSGKGAHFSRASLISGIIMNLTEIFLIFHVDILEPLGLAGIIFCYAWLILLGISILKRIIALIQTIVYKQRQCRAPATENESPIN
jgi:hypothetical protein